MSIEQLRTRGSTRVTVGGQDYEIRCLLLRHDPDDPSTDEPVLTLDNVELLVREALTSVVSYCRYSEQMAGEGVIPEAVGLARAYKDVADRLEDRFTREDARG
jgi:hypothetical protein